MILGLVAAVLAPMPSIANAWLAARAIATAIAVANPLAIVFVALTISGLGALWALSRCGALRPLSTWAVLTVASSVLWALVPTIEAHL